MAYYHEDELNNARKAAQAGDTYYNTILGSVNQQYQVAQEFEIEKRNTLHSNNLKEITKSHERYFDELMNKLEKDSKSNQRPLSYSPTGTLVVIILFIIVVYVAYSHVIG